MKENYHSLTIDRIKKRLEKNLLYMKRYSGEKKFLLDYKNRNHTHTFIKIENGYLINIKNDVEEKNIEFKIIGKDKGLLHIPNYILINIIDNKEIVYYEEYSMSIPLITNFIVIKLLSKFFNSETLT